MREILINFFMFAFSLLCIGVGIIGLITAKLRQKKIPIFVLIIGFVCLMVH